MSAEIDILGSAASGIAENADVHRMPFSVDSCYENAKIAEYFKSSILTPKDCAKLKPSADIDNRNGSLETDLIASFRGRPLNGRQVSLPSGYVGIVLKKESTECNVDSDITDEESQTNKLIVSHKFQNVTYWNLDMEPSANDKILQAMKWINIASSIHGPPGENFSQSSSQASI